MRRLFLVLALALAGAVPASAAPTVVAKIATSGPPGGLAATPNGIWSTGRGHLSLIDPAANAIVHSQPFTTLPWAGYGFGSVWVDGPLPAAGGDARTVTRLDPATGATQATVDVGTGPSGIGFGFGSVWVSNHHDGTVSRVDPAANREVAVVRIEDPARGGPQAIATTAGGIWVGVPNMHAVVRIDPATNTVADVARINGCACSQFAVDGHGDLWVSGSGTFKNAEIHIHTTTGDVTWVPINGPGRPWFPMFFSGSIWVPTDAGTLAQIDPDADVVVSSTELGGDFHFSTAGFGSLWLSDEAGSQVWRLNVP